MAQGRSTKIISMIKWTRTRRLSIKNSLSLREGAKLYPPPLEGAKLRKLHCREGLKLVGVEAGGTGAACIEGGCLREREREKERERERERESHRDGCRPPCTRARAGTSQGVGV